MATGAINGAYEQKAGTSSPDPNTDYNLHALSPTIRKSERGRNPVSYVDLNKGDDPNAIVKDASSPG